MEAIADLGEDWQYEAWSMNRRDTVNRVLPVISYLLSDVIIFVDTVEPRRLGQFFERAQEFASTAWAGCKASGWQPSIILVQNKWHYSKEDPDVDITAQFHEHVDKDHTLSKIFASVHFLRIPHSEYAAVLDEASRVLRDTVFQAAWAVRQRRVAHGTLYTEAEWWTLAPLVAEEYSRTREPISLPRMQLRSLQPLSDDHGV